MGINQGTYSSGTLRIGSGETTWKSQYMKTIDDAAKSAAASAETARAAEAGAVAALEAGLHLPVPGENGNWQIWDADTGRYEDSGKASRGIPGTGLPTGGAAGQIPVKQSAANGDTAWEYPRYPQPNLLDNWFFVGGGSQLGDGVFPINQKAETLKTGYGNFFDRWRIAGYASTQSELTESGFTVTGNHATGVSSIRQNFFPPLKAGSRLAVSTLCTTGDSETSISVRCFHADGTSDQINQMTVDGKLRWGVVTLSSECTYISFRISKSTGTATFEAVKAEYGEYQTLARKDGSGNWVLNALPNWYEELRKCQRVLQWIPAPYSGNYAPVGFGICWDTTTARIALPLPVPMISTPTVTFQNSNARIYLSNGSAAIVPTEIVAQPSTFSNANMRNILCLDCTIEGGITREQIILAISGTTSPGGILLSCEPN